MSLQNVLQLWSPLSDDKIEVFAQAINYFDMGQVTELQLSYYLVLLSVDSKTR